MRGRLAAIASLVLLLGACTAGSSASPQPSNGPPTTSPPAAASASAAAISTTSTAWGPILDQAPASFPRYPGAADANGAINEPVTQSLSTSASVPTVSGWYGTALAPRGYKQTSISNPAEDGSVVAEFDGSGLGPGCRAQLTYRPMGAQTFVFVLVAAGCPTS